jgi:hypothetical protein
MGRKPRSQVAASANAGSLPLLQHRLVLNRFLCRQLGCEDFKSLREKLRDQREDWDEDGHSHFFPCASGHQ